MLHLFDEHKKMCTLLQFFQLKEIRIKTGYSRIPHIIRIMYRKYVQCSRSKSFLEKCVGFIINLEGLPCIVAFLCPAMRCLGLCLR